MAEEITLVVWNSSTPSQSVMEVDALGYTCVAVSYVKSGDISAGTIVFEASDDAVNWYPVNAVEIGSLSPALNYALSGTNKFWQIGISGFITFRIRLGVAITGAGTATFRGRSSASGFSPIVASVGGGGGTASWGSITGTLSAQTDLQSALDAKADAPIVISDVAGLQAELDSKLESPIAISNVTGLQTSLDSKLVAPVVTANIGDNQVTFGKIQDVSVASRLLGRGSAAGAGDPEEITLGTNLSLIGTVLNASGGSGSPYLVIPMVAGDANVTWTNMPAAVTFFAGSHRYATKVDLTNFTQVRLVLNKQGTAGAAASIVRLRYITAFSTTVGNWLTIGASEVSIAVNVTNNVLETSWINLVAGAIGDVFITLDGSGGDGTLDPVFGKITAQFR